MDTQDLLGFRWLLTLVRVVNRGDVLATLLGAEAILRRIVAHVFDISLIEVASLLRDEEVDEVVITFQVLGAY